MDECHRNKLYEIKYKKIFLVISNLGLINKFSLGAIEVI